MKSNLTTATFNIPVLFIIFNRPDLSKQVFEMIRIVKPFQLFIAADGPKGDDPEDIQKCQIAREIIDQVDWDCQVKTLLRDTNVGCRVAISSAIDWFFNYVEEGIILEDDCLPSKSFFFFCKELLIKYRDDDRIMQINGNNYLFGKKQFNESYYFSKLSGCWGWATWKRAWKFYDNEMTGFKKFKKENRIADYICNNKINNWLMSYLEEASRPECNIWSTRWAYTIIIRNGLMISPSKNLVKNIGFRVDATSGKSSSFLLYSKIESEEMEQIIHPLFVLPDKEADDINFEIIERTDPRLLYKNRRSLLKFISNFTQYIPHNVRIKIKLFFKNLM